MLAQLFGLFMSMSLVDQLVVVAVVFTAIVVVPSFFKKENTIDISDCDFTSEK